MTRYYLQTKKTSLSYGISDTETTIRLTALQKLDGTSISAADIGDYMTGTFDPGTSKEEIFSIASSGVTVNADGTVDITGVVRGLREGGTAGYSTGGYSAEHGAGAVVVISNNPQLYNQMANKSNPNTFTDLNIFSGYAPQTDTDPVNPNDMTRLSYVQALVLGTLTTIDIVVPGTAGETIADGNLIYLNTDNKWYKTDADTASTVNNVLLGIAKGAGTLNNQITNGILLQGVDNAQSGLTAGQIQYASNTAGAISNTPGTIEVTVGVAKSTTELYFAPRFNQMLTEDQQDAMDGANSPSASNVFLTANDTSGTGSVVRTSLLSSVAYTEPFGSGADGDVTISSNTTLTRDMNYNNLTINNTFNLITAGYRVYVKGTLTNNGTIHNNGGNASGVTGGSAGLGGSFIAGGAGATYSGGTGAGGGGGGGGVVWLSVFNIAVQGTISSLGGNGQNASVPGSGNATGNAAATVALSLIQSGTGGTGGNSTSGGGGAGGAVTTRSKMSPASFTLLSLMIDGITQIGWGSGGGSGSGNVSSGNAGGGGGGQGGCIVLFYRTIVTSGTLSVAGGTGGTGTGGAGTAGTNGSNGLSISIVI